MAQNLIRTSLSREFFEIYRLPNFCHLLDVGNAIKMAAIIEQTIEKSPHTQQKNYRGLHNASSGISRSALKGIAFHLGLDSAIYLDGSDSSC